MQVTVKNINATNDQLDVVVPVESVNEIYTATYNKIYKNARIDGFRKGHIPKSAFESMYGQRVKADALDELFNKFVPEALKQSEVDMISGSYPSIVNVGKLEKDVEFTFSMTVDVYPVLESKDLKSVKTEAFTVKVSEDDLNKVVDQLRTQQAKLEPIDGGEVADGTVANIDFLGKKDGVPFSGGEAKGFDLDIDHAQMIPGFIENIKGHKAGEEFTINCTFPESYHVAELAGAAATFDIKVNSVSKYVLPELNEDFLKAFGYGDKGVEEFKSNLSQNIAQQGESVCVNLSIENIVEKIGELYGEIELPKALVQKEAERLLSSQLQMPKVDEKLKKALMASFVPLAEDRVRTQVLIHGILKNNNIDIVVNLEDIDAVINDLSVAYEDPEEYKNEIKKDKKAVTAMANIASERKLVKVLTDLTDCTVTEKSFNELKDLAAQFEADKGKKLQEKAQAASESNKEQSAE